MSERPRYLSSRPFQFCSHHPAGTTSNCQKRHGRGFHVKVRLMLVIAGNVVASLVTSVEPARAPKKSRRARPPSR